MKNPWGDQWKEQDFSCPSSYIPSSALAPYFTSLFVHSNSAQLCPGYHGFQIKIPALSSEFCRAVLGSWLLQAPGGKLGKLLSFADYLPISAPEPLLLQCPAQAPPFPVLGYLHCPWTPVSLLPWFRPMSSLWDNRNCVPLHLPEFLPTLSLVQTSQEGEI